MCSIALNIQHRTFHTHTHILHTGFFLTMESLSFQTSLLGLHCQDVACHLQNEVHLFRVVFFLP